MYNAYPVKGCSSLMKHEITQAKDNKHRYILSEVCNYVLWSGQGSGWCMYTVFGAPDELGLHFKTVKGITNCAQSPSGTPNTAYVQPGPALQSTLKSLHAQAPKETEKGVRKTHLVFLTPLEGTSQMYPTIVGMGTPLFSKQCWLGCWHHVASMQWYVAGGLGGCLENILGNLPVKRTLSAPPLRVMIDVYVEGRRLNYRNQMVHFWGPLCLILWVRL